MSEPRLSIALCTFNGERYISQQLASLSAQHRIPDELVVFDDGSVDETVARVSEFARTAPFEVRVSANASRQGPTQNFARAAAAATGDIIFFCDQDDLWYPQKTATFVRAFKARPDALCVLSDADLVDDRGRPLGSTLWRQLGFKGTAGPMPRDAVSRWLMRRTVAFGTVMAIRSELRGPALPIPMPWGHDNWTALMAAGIATVSLLPQQLSAYRQHSGQLSGAYRLTSLIPLRRLAPSGSTGITPTDASFRELARRLRAQQHLAANRDVAAWLSAEAEGKADHLQRRGQLSRHLRRRVAPVLRELLGRRYQRHSNGVLSAVRDLLWGFAPAERPVESAPDRDPAGSALSG